MGSAIQNWECTIVDVGEWQLTPDKYYVPGSLCDYRIQILNEQKNERKAKQVDATLLFFLYEIEYYVGSVYYKTKYYTLWTNDIVYVVSEFNKTVVLSFVRTKQRKIVQFHNWLVTMLLFKTTFTNLLAEVDHDTKKR